MRFVSISRRRVNRTYTEFQGRRHRWSEPWGDLAADLRMLADRAIPDLDNMTTILAADDFAVPKDSRSNVEPTASSGTLAAVVEHRRPPAGCQSG